jgi:tetratricopeptide (TPR) repeat protein
MARNNLGLVRMHQSRWNDAEQLFRRAIELHPGKVLVRINLGDVQSRQGKWAEAVRSYRKALDIDPTDAVALDRLAFAQRLATLEPKLPELLKGDYRPRNDQERLRFALLCQSRQLYHSAAGLYAGALAANPRLNDDRKMEWRYNAACCAALAGCGMGEDAGKLDDREKARLRSQALTWLEADLASWSKQAQSDNPTDRAAVQSSMRHWQGDSDLAGVRGKKALDKLPEVERQGWGKLWADVTMLLDKTRGK